MVIINMLPVLFLDHKINMHRSLQRKKGMQKIFMREKFLKSLQSGQKKFFIRNFKLRVDINNITLPSSLPFFSAKNAWKIMLNCLAIAYTVTIYI